jgi:hypothetical protein
MDHPLPARHRISARRLLLTLLMLSAAPPAAAQDVPIDDSADEVVTRHDAPLVYLDCNRCDSSHIRREITFVNYVRDRDAAQVHVLITDQPTASGGRMYTLAFIGRRTFGGVNNTLSFASLQSNTTAQERDGLTEILKLGLVPYVARTTLVRDLRLTYVAAEAGAPSSVDDPWKNWTFEVYGGGNANKESTQSAWNARYGFYANRVTEQWKVRLRPYFNHNVRTIQREDEDEIRTDQRRHGMENYIIRSLGSRWGAGVFVEYITSTVDNLDNGVSVTPALEYSLFPYDEATRRQITFTYRIGYEAADYIEETIYEKMNETLLNHSIDASVRFRQPWGSISSGLEGRRYIMEGDHYRVRADGSVSFQVGSGISINFGGSYHRINDQLALPRRDASLEDILLQQRRLATTYRTSVNVGLSYTFGSIYSNVVNPRL